MPQKVWRNCWIWICGPLKACRNCAMTHPGSSPLEPQAKKIRSLVLAEPCWALFFGALWTEPICPNRMMSCDTKITMNMIMLWSEKLNLGIRSRSVNTVRWEQKASGWSLSSFSIYNHKTHTHTHWWLYNLIRIQYYTSDCNISTQIMDYIYIYMIIYVSYVSVCCSILFHCIRF